MKELCMVVNHWMELSYTKIENFNTSHNELLNQASNILIWVHHKCGMQKTKDANREFRRRHRNLVKHYTTKIES